MELAKQSILSGAALFAAQSKDMELDALDRLAADAFEGCIISITWGDLTVFEANLPWKQVLLET